MVHVNMDRTDERVQVLIDLFPSIVGNITTYCDIGAGNGSITRKVASALKVTNYYINDVIEIKDPHFRRLDQIPTGSVDLVTCFVAIHHFQDPVLMFQEICRILRPAGLLFIREHDVTSQSLAVRLELMHRMYSDPDYPCYFRSRDSLAHTIKSFGFKLIGSHQYDFNFNPQALYHELYLYTSNAEHEISFSEPYSVSDNDILQWLQDSNNVKMAVKMALKTGTKRNYNEIYSYLIKMRDLTKLKAFLHQ